MYIEDNLWSVKIHLEIIFKIGNWKSYDTRNRKIFE